MRNVWTIARREYRLYFISPVAYIVALLILLITGIFFVLIVYLAGQAAFSGSSTTPPGTDAIMNIIVYLFLLALPALTMRLMADEHRNGTLELLLTYPLHDWELVVGKWLGSFLFILSIIAVTLIYPIVLNKLVTPGIDQGLMVTNYLGIILVAAAFLSIGTAISSLFNNQFAAFFATLAVLFFLWWVIGWPAAVMQNGGGIFNYLSLSSHFYDSLLRGTIALSDIVYYFSLTAFGLFLGTVAVEIRRWK
jgi:ABC-2 type transport system permease protein